MALDTDVLNDFPVGRDVDLGGRTDRIITRDDFSIADATETLEGRTVAVIGYGPQGSGQALNLAQNDVDVIIGQRETYRNEEGDIVPSPSFQRAVNDGWIKGENLLPIEEAVQKGDIVLYLASDAGQAEVWSVVRDNLKKGSTLDFAHGFGPHFHEQTGIVAPDYVDVIMVAPKGVGRSVRTKYLEGSGINSGVAVHQDVSGKALETAVALGIGIGSPILFGTTMESEVVSDHFGERMCLLGHVWALAESMYETSREKGMSSRDAFTYSSEQLTQVLMPLIGRSGCEEIYAQATKQDQLGTVLRYEQEFYDRLGGISDKLYREVTTGREAARSLASNSDADYRAKLGSAFKEIDESEMWAVGKEIRDEFDDIVSNVQKYDPFATVDRNYGFIVTNFALAGALIGSMKRQYDTLVNNGHGPSEAANETVEEATESLNPLNQAQGIAWLVTNCSTTAQRGTLDWGPDFRAISTKAFRDLDPQYTNCNLPQGHDKASMWLAVGSLRQYRPGNFELQKTG